MNGMAGSVYTVLTMAGKFEAIFSADEDVPVAYVGDEAPIEFFKDWLLLNQISGEHGHLLNAQNLTPRELYGFCQPPDSGIEVIPPFDDFLLYIQEDAANQIEYNEKQPEELSAMETEIVIGSDDVLDGAYSDADKTAISATLQLFKAFKSFIDSDKQSARIPDSMPNVNGTSVMNKDEAKKLLRYLLDVAINRKAGIPDMTEEQRKRLSDYQWDARVIYDYMTNRVRSRGSRNLLRTPEMKKKYPEIDNQSREEFDSAEDFAEILIILEEDQCCMLDSAHWVTTKTGSHLLIEGGAIVGGAGGKLNGTKVMTKKMLKDKQDDETYIRRNYNEDHDFGARKFGGPMGEQQATTDAKNLSRILGREFSIQKEGTHVFYGWDDKRYDLYRAVPKDKKTALDGVVLDQVSGIDKIKLIKEAGAIRQNLKTTKSGVEKLKMVKRIGEIRDALGVNGKGLDKDGLDSDGMWPMTKAEYDKIHEDYKGAMPNGTPSALKLINGATTIVPVKITDESPSDGIKTQFNIGDYVVAIKDVGFYGKSPMQINHIKTDFGNDGAQRLKLEGKGNMYFNASDFAKAENNSDPIKAEVAKSMSDVRKILPVLMRFVGKQQLEIMMSSAKGEEGQFFIDKMLEVANIVSTMPKTYEQDGMGDDAVVYLHYFKGSSDWYITERDMEEDQLQAFGYAKIGSEGELGYINIDDLTRINVELDLYWKPKTIGDIKGKTDNQKQQSIEKEFEEKLVEFGKLYLRLRELRGEIDSSPQTVVKYRIDDLINQLKGYDKSGGREYAAAQLNDEIAILQEAIKKLEDQSETGVTTEHQSDAQLKAFSDELEALKTETDIASFGDRLDEIAARIEQAGLSAELDAELNSAADALTVLMAAAEKTS